MKNKLANVIFSTIHDRWGSNFISIRDQNTFDDKLRQKRLMTSSICSSFTGTRVCRFTT